MPAQKRHIVLITNWFPPKQGVAVNRMLGFANYLDPDKNILTILTDGIDEGTTATRWNIRRVNVHARFSKIGFKAGEHKAIHLSKVVWNVALSRIKGVIDRDWANAAAKSLATLHASHPIDVVISSYAPASTHLAAWQFCKDHLAVKWIADMRDEMSLNPHLSAHERKQLARIEQLVNQRATAVTTVSAPILDDFKKLLPQVSEFAEIRNGFDHQEQFSYNFNPVFTINYAGTFYGAIKPDTFFRGLQLFSERNKAVVKLQFVGTNRNFTIPDQFKSCCEFIPRCSSQEALQKMAHADANLLLLPQINRKGVYSGKIFEYISVKKPLIAAIDPTDVAAELILETNAGFIAEFDDPPGISIAIERAYYLWAERKEMQSDAYNVAQLHRKYQVEKLDQLIDKLTSA